MSQHSDDDQILLLIHYGRKFCPKIPNLQLFPPLLLLLAPAIKKSANEGKLKLQTFCIFNDNHLGNSNLTEWMMQNHLPASHLSESLETTQSCKMILGPKFNFKKRGELSTVILVFSPLLLPSPAPRSQVQNAFCFSFQAFSQSDFQLEAPEEKCSYSKK